MPHKIYIDFVLTPELHKRLQNGTTGHELVIPSKPASVLGLGEIEPAFYDCDIIFGQPQTEAAGKSESLKWIQVSSSGITRYDTPEFRELMTQRGISVCNSAHVYNEACADHALAFMLAQSRQLPQALASTAPNGSEDWQAIRSGGVPLRGQRVLILGFGAIGRRLAKLLAPFEMKLTAYRRTPRGDEGMPVVGEADLPAALAAADHVINILPDSAATQHFFNADRFAQLKPSSTFYNIGRGTTVDQDALVQVLESKQLREAWLDVTDPEPLPQDHDLRKQPNCFITPHTAGGFAGEAEACIDHFLKNLARFDAGEDLENRVI
ncbi:D-2-hydroxyacid dehydrogenase [Pelagicoccus sp. SDUM812002]|uniref:D-2-hydroxyacid dehydrogenase n=1 Tax=Pelagicoccus sp. SDUM812002 TaxID=3041266 RepID=UPI002810716E|nr:D-2-hydroxyacid dehydrogenase [Pelagicoccus sp. SDUM812002]MDQ8187487.1 D-2-hydroxyacid dehydrogenase [Pelagicoccus sp. SDUM812002]